MTKGGAKILDSLTKEHPADKIAGRNLRIARIRLPVARPERSS